MKAVKTHVGRCDSCGEPAAYAQLLSGGRTFRFCEQQIKRRSNSFCLRSNSFSSAIPTMEILRGKARK